MNDLKKLGSIALAALLFAGLSGCSSCSDNVATPLTGYYIDSAVEGG